MEKEIFWSINYKKALIFSITGLLLWSAWGSEVHAEENIKGGFTKENGEYLIESGEQLEQLSEMVANRVEIEPGVDAASASYRLCNDVVVRDRLKIGSRRSPFLGDFNGDGYKITGEDFFIATKYRFDETGQQIEIAEYIRYNCVEERPIRIELEDWRAIEETEHRLTSVPKESLNIYVASEELNMQDAAQLVKLCWDVNHQRNHYSISIVDFNITKDERNHSQWAEDSDALLPFFDLFGEEAGAIMRRTAEEEDSYISFLRLERVGGLDICTFAVRASEKEQYHVLVTGEWEDTEVEFQHLVIPSTGTYKAVSSYEFSHYDISQIDINFDGQEDLLIYEGFTNGPFGAYRVIVWDEDIGEFVWYPSFPDLLSWLEFNEQRVVRRSQSGLSHEIVCEYGVVDGEYVETRKASWDHKSDGSSTLSYYEMGVLIEEHDVTGLVRNEIAAYYPDLDFWIWG